MSTSKLIKIALACTIAALVVAAIYTSAMISDRHNALQKVQRYDVADTVEQTVLELSRMENVLLRLQRDDNPGGSVEAKLRYDILKARLYEYTNAEIARFVSLDPGRGAILGEFRAALAKLAPTIGNLRSAQDAAATVQVLDRVGPRLSFLAAQANAYSYQLAEDDARDLRRLHNRFAILTFGLILSGLALVGALMWQVRLIERAHRSLGDITRHWRTAAADLDSARAEAEKANLDLRCQNALFDAALNNMSQGLCTFDGNDIVPVVVNRTFEHMFRLRGLDGQHSSGATGMMTPELAAEIRRVIASGHGGSFETACSDGRTIAAEICPTSSGGWVATFDDVSEQRRAQSRIEHMARHDVLTDLPNRYAFRERLNAALAARQAGGGLLAIMCLDLDHFKTVNDTLGHPTGDKLLCAAAERLVACVRGLDTVARFGGDEFAILLPFVDDRATADALGRRIVEEMSRPFDLANDRVHVTSSIGIALSDGVEDDADKLLKDADLALYAAKGEGRHAHRFFEPEMGERLSIRHAMERDVRLAIASNQFDLHYQPVVDLRSRLITGFEALIRWNHPMRGAVPPSEFITIAEETGLICEIGRFVLRRACSDMARWPGDLKIAVNLSAAQFTQSDVVADVTDALEHGGIQARRLVVEITESLLLKEDRATLDKLRALKALGVEIAMDDFGTGYSSLSYLRQYPFDRIKIDRSFVQTAGDGEHERAIVQTIVELGRSLGMTTVAEGIETEAELRLLLDVQCTEGQGYLFSPPVPRDQVPGLISRPEQILSRVA